MPQRRRRRQMNTEGLRSWRIPVLESLRNVIGGGGGIRTPGPVIMIHLLCQLSYAAVFHHALVFSTVS